VLYRLSALTIALSAMSLAAEPRLLDSAAPAVVLIFTRTDCPISNRYAPEVERIAERFQAKGVEFHLVYPQPGLSAADMEKHRAEFGYQIPALLDSKQGYVKAAGATVTPEAAIFVKGKRVYLGRIDDRFPNLGIVRPKATSHDLEDAVGAVLNGRAPAVAVTRAIGCAMEKAP